MLKRTMTLFVLLAILAVFSPLTAVAQTASDPGTTSSLLVKLVGGLSEVEQAAVIARNGGVETSSIPALRLHVVAVATADLPSVLAAYQADPLVQSAEVNKTRLSEAIPADPFYAYQWALPRIGWDQVFGVITPTGSARVALLDTGVDASHPELVGKVVPGISMLDSSDGRTDPSGHGTALAGIIAANTDGSPMEGIAGLAYAGVQIMPVTVLNANGEGQDSDVIRGVLWAADHGADVILMAFSAAEFSQNLQDAIDYAWSKGVVLVAAAGNNAVSTATFPAGDRGVMGVAATDPNDAQAYFSNAGQAVFIAAPGVDIQTLDLNGNYIVLSGTSTAAAHVAGLAAFMKAVDPTLSNGVIVGRIARNADPAGTAEETGNGRINMPRALADTSMEEVQPVGAQPVGEGGPFVGPYRAAGNATVSGTVKNGSGNPISGATVSCTAGCSGVVTTTTNAAGIYPSSGKFKPDFSGQGPTTITLTASAAGFTSATQTVSAENGESYTVDFVLQPACTPPSITTHPTSRSITYGANATFSAAANGNPTPTVQWQISTNGGAGWSDLPGEVSTTLTVTKPGVSLSGTQYRARFTNTCGGTQTATTNAATLTVTAKSITVTPASGQNKIYGAADPTLTYTHSPALESGDSFTGALNRASGENVGTYAINLGTLSAGPNYSLNVSAGVQFTITARDATWTTAPNSKTYGDLDPAPLTTGSGSGFLPADGVSATYSRATGDNVGSYHITATLGATVAGALANYNITNAGAEFTISPRNATWTTNPSSKTYGDADPSPLTTGSGVNFVASDGVSATYTRVAGTNVGGYHITATLSATVAGALANYNITNAGAEFTISPRNATWTTNPSSKTYGDADPSPLTSGSGSGFLPADGVSATYSRVTGDNVGSYHITAALSATVAGALANYNITNAGAEFTISPRNATWTTNPSSKTYGDADPSPLTTGSGTNFVASDGVSATYSRVAGTNVGGYHITATLSAAAAGALANYNITNAGGQFTITPRNASWTTNPNSKILGNLDPSPLTTGYGSNFLPGDGVSATYTRVGGETIGSYHITAALSATVTDALANYNITNGGAEFAIYYDFTGFFQPIDNLPTVNRVKAGQAIPISFSLHGYQGMNIFMPGYPGSTAVACSTNSPVSDVETVNTPGASGLTYDAGTDRYHYVWKTDKSWAGGCRQLVLRLADGSVHIAMFNFTK